jgi:hypothetical protein
VGPAQRCVEVLSGNGERVRFRAELVEQKRKLEMAIRVLAELGKDGVVNVDSMRLWKTSTKNMCQSNQPGGVLGECQLRENAIGFDLVH